MVSEKELKQLRVRAAKKFANAKDAYFKAEKEFSIGEALAKKARRFKAKK